MTRPTRTASRISWNTWRSRAPRRGRPLQIAETIEDVGGYINAWTAREVTAYYARVLKDDVPLAMDAAGRYPANPAFDADEIEIERGVILQEIGQAADTPDDIIFDWLQEAAYPGQPIGRTSWARPSGCAALPAPI
jgi:predicted Zn-dependent peptidase